MNNKLITRLLDVISKDSKNPSTRLSLSDKIGLNDRQCRDLRRQAFLLGFPIVAFSDCKGSYLTDDKADVQRYVDEARSRALKELATVQAGNRILERWEQIKLN